MTDIAMQAATGRSESMFSSDIDANATLIADRIKGCRVLAIGAAGSIGSETVKVLARFSPAALHVVDHNENGLTELVRQFRSSPDDIAPADLRTLPIDYGSRAMKYFLDTEPAYDVVINFAALKHVRSEKDPFSTLQMFDTNIVKQARIIGWLKETGFSGRYFSVSTDKAANPSSLMGATKRVMEHVMFDKAITDGFKGEITSARFANVAFSNGSLLQSFENRFARGEPIACPMDIRRYFVSMQESGEICTLAALVLPHDTIGIPNLDPAEHLVPLRDIAVAFIEGHGFKPRVYSDELDARRNATKDRADGAWPLLMTPADTAGEKPYEEFVAEGETVRDVGLTSLRGVVYRPTEGSVPQTISAVQALLQGVASGEVSQGNVLTKDALKTIIASLEPGFLDTHRDSVRSLDQRA